MTRIRSSLPSTSNGWAVLLGLLGLALGLALAWPPLGLIVPSAIVLVMGLLTPPDDPSPEEQS